MRSTPFSKRTGFPPGSSIVHLFYSLDDKLTLINSMSSIKSILYTGLKCFVMMKHIQFMPLHNVQDQFRAPAYQEDNNYGKQHFDHLKCMQLRYDVCMVTCVICTNIQVLKGFKNFYIVLCKKVLLKSGIT